MFAEETNEFLSMKSSTLTLNPQPVKETHPGSKLRKETLYPEDRTKEPYPVSETYFILIIRTSGRNMPWL